MSRGLLCRLPRAARDRPGKLDRGGLTVGACHVWEVATNHEVCTLAPVMISGMRTKYTKWGGGDMGGQAGASPEVSCEHGPE